MAHLGGRGLTGTSQYCKAAGEYRKAKLQVERYSAAEKAEDSDLQYQRELYKSMTPQTPRAIPDFVSMINGQAVILVTTNVDHGDWPSEVPHLKESVELVTKKILRCECDVCYHNAQLEALRVVRHELSSSPRITPQTLRRRLLKLTEWEENVAAWLIDHNAPICAAGHDEVIPRQAITVAGRAEPYHPVVRKPLQNVLNKLPDSPTGRKTLPIMTGAVDYFPLALAEVAKISKAGNEQHNPGQPLHWARGKSSDHADCVLRHLVERGTIDKDGQRHTAKAAWRALALLQEELEAEAGWKPRSKDGPSIST
jgi:hypothetical protein